MGSKSKQKKSSLSTDLARIHPWAAGADLGATHHYVALDESLVAPGEMAVRVFPSHSAGLAQMAEWLLAHQIRSIAMEATGVYWLGVFEVLEAAGLEVCLVNARHLKNVSGRKTDVADCKWIQQLHSYGLLRPSFVPDQVMRDLRSYVRQRGQIEKEKSRALLHIHKALDLMNLKVHHGIRNLDGPTGMKILRAIAQGQTDADVLSRFHNKRLKMSRQELAESLQGNYRAAHVFGLRQALQRYDFAVEQRRACELEIEKLLVTMTEGLVLEEGLTEPIQPARHQGKKNDYGFELKSYLHQLAGVDLTAIDGLGEPTVLEIISEVGVRLQDKWPTVQHFTSWLRLAPQVKISGGKAMGHYPQKGANRAHQAFRLAAYGLANSKSALGAYYRQIRYRKGKKVANKAVARKIAVIFYHMLTKQEEYHKSTAAEYEARYQAQKLKRLRKDAERMGFELKKAS